jgi:hypothetical protein
MTTQINVIVDNGGLSAKAKQQTQANRWQKLEADNRQKVEQQGLQQRDAERLLRGIGPDGRPLYGSSPAQLLRRDEPAAWRISDSYAVAGVQISGILSSKPSNAKIRTVTLSTVDEAVTQTFDLYEFPFEPGYNSSGTTFNAGRSAYTHSNALASTSPQYSSTPITGPGFGPAASAGLPSIKTVSNVQRIVSQSENYTIAHLPLSGGALLLAIAGRYTGVATIRNEVWVETVHAETQPTLSPNPLNESRDIFFRNHSTTLAVNNSEEAPQSGDYTKCWLVTPNTIREVPAPVQLKTKLLAYVPQYNYTTTNTTTSYTLTNRTYTDAGLYYAFDQPFETLPNSTPQPVRISAENRVYGNTYWAFISPISGEGTYVFCDYAVTTQTATRKVAVQSQVSAGEDFYNFDRYGLWGFASVDACYSPGVYAQLDDTNISYDSALNEDISYLASAFMPSYPLPRVALQAVLRQDASNNDFRRFDIRKPMSNVLVAENLLQKNKSKQASFAQFSGFDFVWDWGKPGFCRSKLLALGFSESDLTP